MKYKIVGRQHNAHMEQGDKHRSGGARWSECIVAYWSEKYMTGAGAEQCILQSCECFYVCVLFPVLTAFCQLVNKRICYCY